MIVDLTHNKILEEALSEGFKASLVKNLLPMLEAKFGSGIDLLQMYEDYIKEDFEEGGFRYYPFSVCIGGECRTVWCKWSIADKENFAKGNPYGYLGDDLAFFFADGVPQSFNDAIGNRARCFSGEYIRINIHSPEQSYAFLAGRYSQSFIDEMRRQLTEAIEESAAVKGIAKSSVELDIVFAPETYMEHTSENVTYRRLLMTAKGCAPRDFWVKWTRTDASSAYSITDNPKEGTIIFEIGEDVSHKIREKEYRFLVYGNSDKYRNAMGRKNITEWRELIKRSLKRGELERCASYVETQTHAAELNDKLSEILARSGISLPEVEEIAEAPRSDEFEEAMRIARRAAGYSPEESAQVAEPPVEESRESLVEDEPKAVEAPDTETAPELVKIPVSDVPDTTYVPEIKENAEKTVENGTRASDPEYGRLLSDIEKMRAEFERMRLERQTLENKLAASEQERAEQERRLREQMELEAKKNEREKALFAEAARLAREENDRLVREREERERAEREAEARRLAQERERLELERLEAERLAEIRRIELQREAEERERLEALERAREAKERSRARLEETRTRNEEIAKRMAERMLGTDSETSEPAIEEATEVKAEAAPAPAPAPVKEYTYTQKLVRLIFRHNVDPNVTARIKEMIVMALDYFGKAHVYMKIKASIPEANAVLLNFVQFPEEEMQMLLDIIQILGNSDLGITKIIME